MMTTRRREPSIIVSLLLLLAAFIGVAALDDPDLYDPKPGPSALTLPPKP